MTVQRIQGSKVVFTAAFEDFCCITGGGGLYSDEVRRLKGNYNFDQKRSRYDIKYARAAFKNEDYFDGPLNAQREAQGMGTLVWSKINIYVGGFLKGMFHGIGTHATPTQTYIGSYEQGRRHGQGTLISPPKGRFGRISIVTVTYDQGQLKSEEPLPFELGGLSELIQNQHQDKATIPQERVVSIEGENLKTYACSEGLYSTSGKVNRLVGPHPWEDSQYQITEAQVEFKGGRYFIGEFNSGRKAHNWGTLIFENATFIGNYREGVLQGPGVQVYKTGETYIGNFVNSQRHGKGMLIFQENDSGYRYYGDFKNGQRHGQGKLEYRDGTTYEGGFQKDKYHGKGTLIFRDGRTYEGDFADGDITGQGKLKYSNGKTYEGSFQKGKFHGEGIMTYPNGQQEKLVNGLKQNKAPREKHLQPKVTSAPGKENQPLEPIPTLTPPLKKPDEKEVQSEVAEEIISRVLQPEAENSSAEMTGETLQLGTATFKGQTRDGKPHGTGLLTFQDGTSNTLEFSDGLCKISEHVFRDGRIYTGGWSNGQFNGQGLLQFPHGHEFQSYKGNFVDGQFEAKSAILTISKSDKFVGGFSKNLRHGNGMLITAQGRQKQTWTMGVLNS